METYYKGVLDTSFINKYPFDISYTENLDSNWHRETICMIIVPVLSKSTTVPHKFAFRFLFVPGANVEGRAGWAIDNIATYYMSSVGGSIKGISNKFKLYPNPITNHTILVENPEMGHNIFIYDVFGKLVESKTIDAKINISRNILNGVYYYQIKDKYGTLTDLGKLFIK